MASKQISLADLAKNSKSVKPNNKTEAKEPELVTEDTSELLQDNVPNEKPLELHSSKDVVTPKGKGGNDIFSKKSKKGAHRISSNEIIRNRIESGEIKPQKDEIKDSPIVDAAFKSMTERLNQSKEYIENVVKPIVYQNAEEIAMEQELGTSEESMRQAELELDKQIEEMDLNESNAAKEHYSENLDKELNSIDNYTIPNNTEQTNNEPIVNQSINDFSFEEDTKIMEKSTSSLDELEAELMKEQNETEPVPVEVTSVPEESTPVEVKPVETEPTEVIKLEEPRQESAKLDTPRTKIPETMNVPPTIEMPSVASMVGIRANDDMSELIDNDGNKASLSKLMADLDKEDSTAVANTEDNEDETPEEIRAKFKKVIENTTIIQNKADLKQFSIRKSPVSSSYILNQVQSSLKRKYADWGMYHSKVAARYSEVLGPELDNLRKTMNGSNQINRVVTSLRFIYDHTIDANKPDFESWCKLRRTEDINSGYYGIYRATYYDSNLVARTCINEACKKMSLIETNIDDMVVYGTGDDDSDKIKAEFQKICSGDTSTPSNAFKATLVQISDDFVAAYSPASFYSTFLQYSTLKDSIAQKYSDLLDIMAYIDSFYYIDRNTNELVLIDIKHYPGDIHKEVLSKLQTFTGILKTLTADQYSAFTEKLANVIEPSKINYRFPAVRCPECGQMIPEMRIESMIQVLFTRAQLARIRSL